MSSFASDRKKQKDTLWHEVYLAAFRVLIQKNNYSTTEACYQAAAAANRSVIHLSAYWNGNPEVKQSKPDAGVAR